MFENEKGFTGRHYQWVQMHLKRSAFILTKDYNDRLYFKMQLKPRKLFSIKWGRKYNLVTKMDKINIAMTFIYLNVGSQRIQAKRTLWRNHNRVMTKDTGWLKIMGSQRIKKKRAIWEKTWNDKNRPNEVWGMEK